jgi:tetratricopeptide (TPR) repeat protein
MKNLDSVAEHLRLRLLVAKSLDERRNLTFYLGWAETYQGHQLLNSERWAKASNHYQAAIMIDPANLAPRLSLSISLAHQHEFELALIEVKKAVAVFNEQHNKERYEEALWHWHRNEVSSEYEQKAGIFQACALLIALLRTSPKSGGVKEMLEKEITAIALQIPDYSAEELIRIIARKGGTAPGALSLVAAGPYRAPATPLDLLEKPFCMPLLTIQTIESAA